WRGWHAADFFEVGAASAGSTSARFTSLLFSLGARLTTPQRAMRPQETTDGRYTDPGQQPRDKHLQPSPGTLRRASLCTACPADAAGGGHAAGTLPETPHRSVSDGSDAPGGVKSPGR